jgi:hypothetical protein
LGNLIDASRLGTFTLFVVIADATGVGLFAFLAQLSSHLSNFLLDQTECDRPEIWAHDLDAGLVGRGRRELYILPVQDSGTQWHRNGLKNPSIRIAARGVEAAFQASPVTGANAVKSVRELPREVRCGGR